MKKCLKCKETKAHGEFYKKPNSHDGYRTQCKACDKIYRQSDRGREVQRAWIQRDPEHARKLARVRSARYCKAHPDEVKARSRTYKESELGKMTRIKQAERRIADGRSKLAREKYNSSSRGVHMRLMSYSRRQSSGRMKIDRDKYRTKHHDRFLSLMRIYNQNRRSSMAGTVTRQQWFDVLEKYKHSCAYCGCSDVPMTMDHVVPLANGGNHFKDNIVPACRPCNLRKHVKPLDLYAIQR